MDAAGNGSQPVATNPDDPDPAAGDAAAARHRGAGAGDRRQHQVRHHLVQADGQEPVSVGGAGVCAAAAHAAPAAGSGGGPAATDGAAAAARVCSRPGQYPPRPAAYPAFGVRGGLPPGFALQVGPRPRALGHRSGLASPEEPSSAQSRQRGPLAEPSSAQPRQRGPVAEQIREGSVVTVTTVDPTVASVGTVAAATTAAAVEGEPSADSDR